MRRRSGADITLLLMGNAVHYAVYGQQLPPLSFGTAVITFPPRLDQALRKAIQASVKLVLLRDDVEMRGIPASALMPEAEQISCEQRADFLHGFDIVWHW